MTSLHELIEAKGPEWVERHLRAELEPRDRDREALIEYLVDGLSPVLSAQKVHVTGKSNRAYEGLVWYAYTVENQLFEILGEGIEVLLAELIANQEVEVATSRIRRLEFAADAAGLFTKRVTLLRVK